MPDSPRPIFSEPIALGCEVDPSLRDIAAEFDRDKSFVRIQLAKIFRDIPIQIVPEDASELSCWLLYRAEQTIPLYEAKRARLLVARAMGLWPAKCYDFLPQFYDDVFAVRHKTSFSVRCKHFRGKCIRPSHLVLCTADGRPVPTLFNP